MSQLTERFAAAVRILVGDGTVKERLGRAYLEQLETLDEAELPPALRPPFGQLREAMTRVVPVGKEGAVRASVQKMSAADAARHARSIVELYAELGAMAGERPEPLKIVGGAAKAPPPPRFLTGRS